jgi:alpha-tubulin suppressor-like RCC1 family protein
MTTFFRCILAGWILSIALPFLTPGVLAQTQPYAWGWNSFGQVGNNSPAQQNLPAAVSASGVLAGKTVVALSAGENHTLALCSDGSLASWGWNWYGQLGIGNNAQSLVPVMVNASAFPSPNSVTAIAAGQLHSLALCSNGALFAWGHNVTGVLGNGSLAGSLVPVGVNQSGVLSGKVVKAIAAGYNHCLVLCADGTLAAWGNNFSGQLGNNSTTPSSLPILVEASGVLAGRTVIAIAAGHGHSLVLCSDGSMVSWGQNSSGQLGNNSFTDSLVPVLVNMNVAPGVFLGRTVVAISAGDYHSLGLCDDGAAIAWGLNSSGQVGENTSNPWRSVPGLVNTTIGVSALAGKTVTAIAAGSGHNLVVCSDGTVAAWGRNSEGQIGDNSTTQRPAPVSVDISALPPGTSFNRVFSGSSAYHSLALPVAAPCPPQILVRGSSVTILKGDTTPTGGDSTAFFDAAVCGNASVTHQFTVFNFGNCPLTVTNIVSSNPAEFSVSAGTFPIVIPGGGSWSDFSVTFNPSAVGDRSATISLINDDPTANPYTFAVNGNGIASQIGVLGNNPSAAILNGDLTPTLTDDTAFGSLQVNSTGTPHVFTITNIGTATLLLNGAPPVAISGPNAGEFTVNQPTVTSVLPGGTATFSVVFHPGVIGLCTATLSITNSDCTATPYEFAIQGEGAAPPPLELACAGNKIVKCDQVWTFDPPVATNACGAAGVTLTVVNTTTNGSCPKTVIRTWLATDACGNTATCSQTVTVVDTTPPVLTCATNKTVQCSTAWIFDAPTASDACSTNVTISIFNTVTNGICPLVITRAWLATDPCGNTSTCSQTVTVAPALPPNSPAVISGPIYNPANGHYYYLLAENTWTASEVEAVAMGGHLATVRNQAENSWIYTQFSQFGGVSRGLWIGLNDVAQEGAFVWASGEPVSYFNWGSNEPVNQNGLDDYVHLFWPGDARASQWNDQWDVIVMGSGSAGVSINGVVEVSNLPPLLACAPNKTVACGSSWDFDAPNASDSCSGANVTVTVVNTVTNSLNPLVITRTWQAVNACNNTNTCSQVVSVVDTTPPVLTCATNKTVQCGTAWTFDAPTVSDSCSGTNLTVSILSTVTNGVCPRVITRTWQATDAYGNTNTCSQVVSVVDTTPPVLTCSNPTVMAFSAGTTNDDFAGLEPAFPSAGLLLRLQIAGITSLKGFDDNCAINTFFAHTFTNLPSCISGATLRVRLKGCVSNYTYDDTFGLSFTSTSGALAQPGWSRYLGSHNSNPATGLFTDFTGGTTLDVVLDLSQLPNADGSTTDLIPTLNAQGLLDLVIQDDSSIDFAVLTVTSCCGTNINTKTVNCGTDWIFDAPTVSDSCSGTNVTLTVLSTVTNGVCPRIITRTWKATDACGNSVTNSQAVTVVDTTPSVLTCATNKTVQCGKAWAFDAPTVSDSCSGTNLTVSILSTVTNGVCPRIITRTWVATDGCGNTAKCSQSVTVVDTMPPTIACPGNITRYTCANAIRVYYAAWAWDACSPTVSLSYSPPSGSYFAAGTTTPVTVTATDGCGNTSTCTFQVKVINQNASQILVGGLPDCYNLWVADPAAVRSACLNSSYSPALWNSFDNSTINRRVGVSWQGLPSSITSAQVTTRMKPRKTLFNTPQNDTIAFGLGTCNPASWLWSQSIGTVLGQPWLFQPNCGVTFAFNLQALPPGGGTTSLLPHLNSSSHRLDMLVQNDTVVDYAWMRIRYCAPIIFNGSSVTLGNAIAIATPSGWLLAQDPEVVGATNASAVFALGDTLHARLSLGLAALTQSPQGRLNVSFSATDSEEVVEDFGFQLVSTPRADGPATTWQPVAPSGSSNPRVRLMNAGREVGASSGMKPIQVRGEIPAAEIIFNGGTNVIARFATTVSVGGGAGGPPLLVDAIQFSFDLSAAPDVASTVIVLNLSEFPEVGIRGLASGSARGFDAIQGNVLAQSSGDMIVLSPQDEDSNDPFGVSLSVAPAHEFRAVLGASFDVFAPTSPGSSLALFTRGLVGGQDRELPGLRFDYTKPGWTLAATRDGTPLPLRRAQVWNRGAIVADLMSPTSVQWASLPQLHWPSLVGTTDAEIVHRFPSSTAVDVVVDGMTYSGTEVRITTGTFGEPVEALTGLRVEAVRAELLAMSPLDVGAVSYRLEVPESGDDEVTVRWSGVGGVLESASSLDGAWSAVAGSEGGEVTLPVETATARFFRVRGQ